MIGPPAVRSGQTEADLPFRPTRRVVSLPDGRGIAHVESGDGPPVVLVHGTLTLLEDMWLGLASGLLPDHRVIALDRPGHGSSPRRRLVDASPWRQAEIIHDALQEIGVVDPVMVGHSYGGTVALCYGLAFPARTRGVVALAPLCFPEIRLEHFLFGPRSIPGIGDVLAQALASSLDPVLLPLLWRAIFLPQPMPERFATGFPFAAAAGPERMCVEGEDAAAAVPALALASLAYPTCRVPVRIFGGTTDIVVQNGLHGRRAAMMMPRGRFDWIPGVGHMLHHGVPGEVSRAVRELLA